MNKLITVLLLLSIGFVSNNQENKTTNEIVQLEKPNTNEFIIITDELYDLQIEIEQTENNNYNLVVSINLHNGSYFISPNAKRDFKGKFYMDLGSYTHLDFEGDIIETPRSVEEFDDHPFVDGTVNWVRENTSYKQSLNLISDNDFEVFGRIIFTIEPRCTLEEISFAISYKNGVMKLFSPNC